MDRFENAVRVDPDRCKGCINCIKRCPTGAVRVRDGKASIIKQFCIDCGECIRVCPHHAKRATYDPLSMMDQFEYKIALPAPSLYAQFNHLEDSNIVLAALKKMGFDDVFEVAAAAEIVSEMTREYVKKHRSQWPIISTACPSVVKLIRVRFPNLIDHLLPIQAPVDVAASMARKMAMEKTGLPSEKIGIFFLSPCPAKVSASRYPMGIEKSEVDGVLAIKKIYPVLLPYMKEVAEEPEELAMSGKIGVGWGSSGGEAGGLLTDNYLAADGIENVIHVLEDLEDEKFDNLEFIELNACSGGCVGGVLTVENPYVAKVKLKKLRKYLPVAGVHVSSLQEEERREIKESLAWTEEVEYEPVFKLGNSMKESIKMMSQVETLMQKLPGIDCGSCGAPSCRALAEDIVRGVANESDCIYVLREYIERISGEMSMLAQWRKKD